MPQVMEGHLDGRGLKFGIVVSRFNEIVTGPLLSGALDVLGRHGVADSDVTVVKVPGAMEIPQAARRLALRGNVDGVLCLGAVIRGETPHFDYICAEVSRGVAAVHRETGLPVIFGVLTTHTLEQALDRAGGKNGNKGAEAALAALEMANLFRNLGS